MQARASWMLRLLAVVLAASPLTPARAQHHNEIGSGDASALSEDSVRLIAAFDEYLRALADDTVGAADRTADGLSAALEVARSALVERLAEGGMPEADAEALLDTMSDPAASTNVVEDEISRAFPVSERVGVWLDRVAIRRHDASAVTHVPSLLVGPRAGVEDAEFNLARVLSDARDPAAFEGVRGPNRTETLRELLAGVSSAAIVVGERIVIDFAALEERVVEAERRIDRFSNEAIPTDWAALRPLAEMLSAITNLDGVVMAARLMRADAERTLFADPDIDLALRSGAGVRSIHRNLLLASELDLLSRGRSVPAMLALIELLASDGVWPIVQLSSDMDSSDPDAERMHGLLTAASFGYRSEPRGAALRAGLTKDAQALQRFVWAATGVKAGLSLDAVALEARDRFVRAGLAAAAIEVDRRAETTDEGLLAHLLTAVLEGNPQDTMLMYVALRLSSQTERALIEDSRWREEAISGYLARRAPYHESPLRFSEMAVFYSREKLERGAHHGARSGASGIPERGAALGGASARGRVERGRAASGPEPDRTDRGFAVTGARWFLVARRGSK